MTIKILLWDGTVGQVANGGTASPLAIKPRLGFKFNTLHYTMGAGTKVSEDDGIHVLLTAKEIAAIDAWLEKNAAS